AGTGAEAFYQGEIATAIAGFAARTGGLLTAEDLDKHRSTWVEPISTGYRGYEVWEIPPNGQGLAALIALTVLEGDDLAGASLERRRGRRVEAGGVGVRRAAA